MSNEIRLGTEMYRDFKYGIKSATSSASDFAEKNKETVRQFGLFNICLQAGVIIFFCIFLIYFGYIWYIDRKIFNDTTGKIVESDCAKNSNNKESITYNCNVKVKFNYGEDKEHIFSVNTNSTKKYDIDENIAVYYDVKDPTNEPSIEKNYNSYLYIGMIFAGFVGIGGSIAWIYSAIKYEFVAQAQGVKSGLELATNATSSIFGKRQ